MNNSEERPKQKKKSTDNEIYHRFNELRRQVLDNRAANIDRWLSTIAIALAFLGVVVVVGGYISIKQFLEIKTEAEEYLQDIKDLVEKTKKNYDESTDILQNMTAEKVTNDPKKAEQAVAEVTKNSTASLIDKAISRAVFLQLHGKRDEAIEQWRDIVKIAEGINDPQAARGWLSISYLLKNPEEKILAYDQAISLDSKLAEAYNGRGFAKTKLGLYDEALDDFEMAISLQPDYAQAYNNRGAAKNELDRYREALDDFGMAIQLKPDYANAYNNRGNANAKLDRYIEAFIDYNKVISLQPDYAEAYINRGVMKVKLKQIDEARQDFEKARDLARDAGNDSLADAAEKFLRGLDSQEDN